MVQPPPARPTPSPERAPRHRSRRPWAAGLTAVLGLAAAAGVAGLSAGCATEPAKFHENPVGVLPQNSLSRAWFVDLDLGEDPTKQVVDIDVRSKLVYVYTADKRVTAIDRLTGVVKFVMAVKSPEARLQPLVELEGFLVFANATNLQVYDDHGTYLKTIPVPTPIRSRATGESDETVGTNRGTTVYFGASGVGHGGLVEAYDISRQSAYQKWEFITHAQGAIVAAPAVYRGYVYTGDDQGEVDAVSNDRVQVWNTDGGYFMTSGGITADLKIDESGLYVASTDSKLYSINRSTGKLQWQYFSGGSLSDSPVLTPDTIYQNTPNHGLVALDKFIYVPPPPTADAAAAAAAGQANLPPNKAYNRSPLWTCPDADRFLAQDAKFAYVEVVHSDPLTPEVPPTRTIVALDKQTGKKVFESDHHDFSCFGVNPRDGLIYVAFKGGKIMALQPVLHAGQIGELVKADTKGMPALAMAR